MERLSISFVTEVKRECYIFGTLVVAHTRLMLERPSCIFCFICTFSMTHEHDRWNMNMIGENIENHWLPVSVHKKILCDSRRLDFAVLDLLML